MENRIPPFLLRPPAEPTEQGRGKVRVSFVDRGVRHAAKVVSDAYVQWELASREGLLQKIDARVKLFFLLSFVVVVSLKREIGAETALGGFIFLLAAVTRVPFAVYCRRVFFFGFLFGFLVALPSSLNVITPGRIIIPLLTFPEAYEAGGYHLSWHLPRQIGITEEGMRGVLLLTLRVVNSLALSFLVLFTTPLPEIIRGLKVLKVPDVFIVMLTLSYKYIFLFAQTVEEVYRAKKSRLAGGLKGSSGREWVAGRMAFLFRKTQMRCEDVYKAMLGRGFSDEVRISGFRKLSSRDWMAGAAFAVAGIFFLLL
ncbi:MAG: cobalt ECF transporter T component CbiQ [Nitrospirales bacterium]|nr:cobalt ECF transporter T component CbiQ [Nitrospirales bacterium]